MKTLNVRERIIETASILFYENGYTQTGINQIIEEASVAKTSLYQHFKSKEDIAVITLQRRHVMWISELTYCTIDKKSPKEKITASFDYLNSWLAEVNFRGCGWQNIFTELPVDHYKIKEQVVFTKSETRKWCRSILKEDEQYSTTEANQLGDQILVLMEGAIILAQMQKEAWPIKSAKKACVKLLS